MQKQEKNFFEGHQSTFWIKMPFGIGQPPTYTSIAVYMCGGGFKGPKLSNGIQLSRFVQKLCIFSDFVVPMWSPSSSHRPHHSRQPHVVPIAPRRSPCGHHGLWSPHVVPVVPVIPTSSPSSPHHPFIPTLSRRSPHHPQPPRYPLHPPPPPGGWGSRISKNAIRFELIKIF